MGGTRVSIRCGPAMDFRQLNALLAVADPGASPPRPRSLHTVQSNVSTHVARLERELDAILVDRHRRLTEEGQVVVARARRLHRRARRSPVRLASLGTRGGRQRPPRRDRHHRPLARAAAGRPLRESTRGAVVVVDAPTTSLLPQLADGRLDAAVVNLPSTTPTWPASRCSTRTRAGRAARGPTRSPGAGDAGRDRRHPLLLEPPGTALRDDLDRQAAAPVSTSSPQAEIDGMRLLASSLVEGYGPRSCRHRRAAADQGRWRWCPSTSLPPRGRGVARHPATVPVGAGRAVLDVIERVVEAARHAAVGACPAPVAHGASRPA